MKKPPIILMMLLTFYNIGYSQSNFFGLFNNNYTELKNSGSTNSIKNNKSISIIYNSEICNFFLEGTGTRTFPILNFRREIENNGLVTTFISGQTSATPEGYFWVRIEENKEGINFQVIQSSVTYVVDKVEKYSENGKVVGSVSFTNYEDLVKRKRYYDSLSIANEKEREILKIKKLKEDSIYLARKNDSIRQVEDKKMSMGDNFNNDRLEWINDTIQSKINIGQNETFYNSFKVEIDEYGTITKIEPNGRTGNVLDKYLPEITRIIVGKKVKPYYSKSNGKYFPSYSIISISLYHDTNKVEKKTKGLLKYFKN
jgi:hypothetical protein